MKRRTIGFFTFLYLSVFIFTGSVYGGAWEQAQGMSGGGSYNIPLPGNPVCVSGCSNNSSNSGTSSSQGHIKTPTGPSPQEIEQERIENMNDANEKGIECFEQRNWDCAVKYFELALEYSPYNPTLISNLKRAKEEASRQQNLHHSSSQQLQTTNYHGNQATTSNNESARIQAGQGFDTPGRTGDGIKPTFVYNTNYSYREPVVPPEKRTPAIAKLEREREIFKRQRNELESKLNQLQKEPAKNQIEIVNIRQKISDTKNQENFLNFSIEVELKKAPDVKNEQKK